MSSLVLLRTVVVMGAFATVVAAQQPQPAPLYTIDLSTSGMVPQSNSAQGTVAFLSEHTIAVGTCAGVDCNLATFELADGSTRLVGHKDGIPHFSALFATHDGGFVLTHVVENRQVGDILLDQDLRKIQWTQRTAGVSSRGEKIPAGQGRLLGHAANKAAYLLDSVIEITDSDGHVLGLFNAEALGGASIRSVGFVGTDHLSFQKSVGFLIVDYHGKVLRRLKSPSLSYKTEFSPDGNLLLFDSFTRHVGLTQDIKDKALIVATMGMSADGDSPNEEIVRVVDTNSGKQCFQWKGEAALLQPFGLHADIDPSGQLVAILTQGSIAIYRLPDAR